MTEDDEQYKYYYYFTAIFHFLLKQPIFPPELFQVTTNPIRKTFRCCWSKNFYRQNPPVRVLKENRNTNGMEKVSVAKRETFASNDSDTNIKQCSTVHINASKAQHCTIHFKIYHQI